MLSGSGQGSSSVSSVIMDVQGKAEQRKGKWRKGKTTAVLEEKLGHIGCWWAGNTVLGTGTSIIFTARHGMQGMESGS